MFFASGLVAGPCEPDSGFLSREWSVSPCLEPPVVGVWKAFRSASSREGVGWFCASPDAAHAKQAATIKYRMQRFIAIPPTPISANRLRTVRFRFAGVG